MRQRGILMRLRASSNDVGAATATLMMAIALALAGAALLFSRIGQAGDMRTTAQTGADAAALGSLEPLRDLAVGFALSGTLPDAVGAWIVPQTQDGDGGMKTQASFYARKNGTELRGGVHLSGSFGRTSHIRVQSRVCQLKQDFELTAQERGDLKNGRNLCTDKNGKRGIGRFSTAEAVARLYMPACHYVNPLPGPGVGASGDAHPTSLVCSDGRHQARVWPAGDPSTVRSLFHMRLVDQDDPAAYSPFPIYQNTQYNGPLPPLPGNASEYVRRIIAYAEAQLGKPYVWGGTGPNGYDCSGLVMMAYATAGVRIPRTTFEQWPFGLRVPPGSEQAGDLVFFAGSDGTMQNPGHVGMVLDPVRHLMIEAACTACGPIRISGYQRSGLVGFTRPLARYGLR